MKTEQKVKVIPGKNGGLDGIKIYLGDTEIQDYINYMSIEMSAGKPLATGYFEFAAEVDIPEGLMVSFNAHVKNPTKALGDSV